MPGDRSDALEPVLKCAPMYRERSGSQVIAAAAIQELAQRRYKLRAVVGVIGYERADPLVDKCPHVG